MVDRRGFIALSAAALAAGVGCSRKPETTRAYSGPQVTHVDVRKSDRMMYLWSNGALLRSYPIDLGFAPSGHKQFEGDGKTPEGQYYIDRRNPRSNFYLSLGISYPNARDVAFAHAQGRDPGGDIFIHGQKSRYEVWAGAKPRNWTAGCIAIANEDMTEVYWMVHVGTPITIVA